MSYSFQLEVDMRWWFSVQGACLAGISRQRNPWSVHTTILWTKSRTEYFTHKNQDFGMIELIRLS